MILITGASGRIARRTAELLIGDGLALRLMTRTPENAPQLVNAQIVRGDFAIPTTLDGAFAGVTTALVVSGSGHGACWWIPQRECSSFQGLVGVMIEPRQSTAGRRDEACRGIPPPRAARSGVEQTRSVRNTASSRYSRLESMPLVPLELRT
jgi:hypothetical protein